MEFSPEQEMVRYIFKYYGLLFENISDDFIKISPEVDPLDPSIFALAFTHRHTPKEKKSRNLLSYSCTPQVGYKTNYH